MPTPNILQSILQALSPQQTPMDVGALRQNFVQQQGQQPPVPTAAGPVPGFPADIRGTPPSTSTPAALPAALPINVGAQRESFVDQKGDQMAGRAKIWDIIKRLAPTAIATGVGMGVPGALPGAAGFAGGFEGEKQRQQKLESEKQIKETEAKRTKTVEIRDPETGELIKSVEIGKNDIVKLSKKGLSNEGLFKLLSSGIDTRVETPTETAAQGKEVVSKFGNIRESDITTTMTDNDLSRSEVLNKLGITEKDIQK